MTESCFLRSVAQFCSRKGPGSTPVDEYVFVLPNKRSAMFLKKYIREQAGATMLMPRFMTMRTFLSLHSPLPEAPQRELLFILYDAYRRTMETRGRLAGVREFDSFIFWGDMMLSDFDDIDRSLVNADDLFRNLKQVKEIQADYLDEEQKDVIRRVWGESRLTADADRFWLHVGDGDEESLTGKFVYLWEILAEVYHTFHRLLDAKGLASAGAQYRCALEAVRALDRDSLPPDTHYAFVGFNDLSAAETLIFEHLRRLGIASFFWDTAPLDMAAAAADEALPVPLRRLRKLVRSFPMPEGFEVPQGQPEGPDIQLLAVPSNIGQAKAINAVLENWRPYINGADSIDTALVLPDQGLLLPALLSIPDFIEAVNISMGLPYRTTTFASLFHSIISMQLRARQIKGEMHFYYEDVNAVLAHPHMRVIAAAEADAVSARIAADRLYNVAASEIFAAVPELRAVFTPVQQLDSVHDVAEYLTGLMDWLSEKLAALPEAARDGGFENDAIAYFRKEVENIARLADEYRITMTERTFLHLFERIFNTRGVTVNGTPLAGMQMLGVLETRSLDFENIIILSMNERVFPRKQYTRTMIPANLRTGFGLPDFESLEWTYAYCFYRLMARARRVTLMYDSRTDGQGNGEISRYILQMRHLMPGVKIEEHTLSYGSENRRDDSIVIEKTPEVMALLDHFRAGGPLRLSASALKTYKACPLRFYLAYARCMRGSDDLTDYILPSQFGTAVHNTVQALYEPLKGQLITADTFERWLDPANGEIDRIARIEVVRERYGKEAAPERVKMSVDADIACRLVASITRENLRAERDFYCAEGRSFTFLANEFKVDRPWHIAEGLDVNFYMSIDRVDRIDGRCLRFVDFKTGADDILTDSLDSLFTNSNKDGIFQLFTYSQAYLDIVDDGMEIMPVLHSMRRFSAGEDLKALRIGKQPVTAYSAYREDFSAGLRDFVAGIFDPAKPFTQCTDSQGCRYCQFRTMCGRIDAKF